MRLDLHVSVPADEWAYLKRRVTYYEAALLRIVRERDNLREWFSSAELAGMLLPGLPTSIDGMARRASQERWRRQKTRHHGRFVYAYHVSSLPARAFDALIARMMDIPDIDEAAPVPDLLPPCPLIPEPVARDDNTAPPWVLPLMRLMRKETKGDLREAWERLPERLPPGVILPTVDEAAHVLVQLGLVSG